MLIFSKYALLRGADSVRRQSQRLFALSNAHTSASAAARPALSQFRDILSKQITGIKDAGTYKMERIITSSQSTEITVEGTQKRILNFCANNYLGLANNPEVVNYSKELLDKYGAGLSSVRFICGTQTIHKQLEKKIAQFHGREDAILYASCFDANAGLFEAILTPDDAVFSDELNHASIIDGIRLCKAQKQRYKHRDMSDLEKQLKSSTARLKLIVTDGVFSMDGNIAPLPKIVDLAAKYDALVFIDECHATGFFGATGRGTEEYHNLLGRVDIINSTLGKALGGAAGGYTTGPKELITLLRQKSRPYLFSNSLPPPVVATGIKVMDMLMHSDQLSQRVQSNTKRFRDAMTKAGFIIAGENHPICPVMLGDARLASIFADQMLSRGIYVIGFSYPVVPKGKARIRVQISAAHTTDDVDHAVAAFIDVGRSLKVIK
ncbi:PREDICTED: 2-amino-3-ketobutyrate coenzyme A ligase, mitochondrial-like [Bactrocera latifrons]|uniref:2-amino-3-ketobutyrate coenzyme A ligase, mitochondrial-like n=1 Tax=Bactrocera latifrons TaxID=174628 RepID=UPI0008DC7E46|nr:PREDICTED: 2-amino-3-ketobutyrate coenzyme A ligase, mitochondrial-like [Bactrocera latifrons]